MRWTPHATVAVVVERDGRFLLVEEQSSGQTVLNQPAGHIEPGETFIAAAIRETREETGWAVEPVSIIGFYAYTSAANGVTYHRMCFRAEAIEHFPQEPLDDGILGTRWLSRDEIAAQADELRSPMVLKCVDDYLAGRAFPLDLICECHPGEQRRS